jgi:hypothetical protein
MKSLKPSLKETYTESEAAELVGITIARLHEILDQNVFNEGVRRPPEIEFTSNDLVLLRYWNKSPKPPKSNRLLQMPRRK